MSVKATVVRLHRWLGLGAGLLWLVQAVTGCLIVFHWQIDDALLTARHRATDLVAIEHRLALLAPAGSDRRITSLWTSGGARDRWDVSVEAPGGGFTARIDGAGNILRTHADGERFADGGWIGTLVLLHQQLLAGETGSWIVGLSGALLLSNLLAGLYTAWPAGGRWRRALTPPRGGRAVARVYGFHRALGLWVVAPALILVTTGVLGVFSDGFARLIGVHAAPVEVARQAAATGTPPGFAKIVRTALAAHPGAQLSGVEFPAPGKRAYAVRLLVPGEPRETYGKTDVIVDGATAAILADRDATRAPLAQRVSALVFPVHTGEIAGVAGRILVLATGLWLATMIVLGMALWWLRRRVRR